ncbi:BapB protein [Paraburkholderia ribeironis]|uniref:BapB protein n=1 Tax=Paraburkholderia ribeironis TaxID=1247936 RepID=A0A1N7SC63_9BURK|nr:acyl carrier protein [Paraburkholderia ribeironis]SIT44960.1 BapB protein [Paraburkholderia ribeironis]
MQVDKTPDDTAAIEPARKLIAQLLCMPEARVSADQRLLDELAMDSLEILELSIKLEERWGITLDETILPRLETVRDVAVLIGQYM